MVVSRVVVASQIGTSFSCQVRTERQWRIHVHVGWDEDLCAREYRERSKRQGSMLGDVLAAHSNFWRSECLQCRHEPESFELVTMPATPGTFPSETSLSLPFLLISSIGQNSDARACRRALPESPRPGWSS